MKKQSHNTQAQKPISFEVVPRRLKNTVVKRQEPLNIEDIFNEYIDELKDQQSEDETVFFDEEHKIEIIRRIDEKILSSSMSEEFLQSDEGIEMFNDIDDFFVSFNKVLLNESTSNNKGISKATGKTAFFESKIYQILQFVYVSFLSNGVDIVGEEKMNDISDTVDTLLSQNKNDGLALELSYPNPNDAATTTELTFIIPANLSTEEMFFMKVEISAILLDLTAENISVEAVLLAIEEADGEDSISAAFVDISGGHKLDIISDEETAKRHQARCGLTAEEAKIDVETAKKNKNKK